MTNQSHKHLASPAEELCRRLENKGHRVRIVSVKRLYDLKQKAKEWREGNLLDKFFYEEHLKDFVFDLPNNLLDAKSILVVASPQPLRRVSFILNNTLVPFMIPSHYSYDTDEKVSKILDRLSKSQKYRFEKASLPLKILAVCSGLAEYGKNNIAYVKGLGSFFRLSAFYLNLPPNEDIWLEPQMMKRCQHCESCLINCPTQAISSERFLIRAERCITYHNERKQDFPSWLRISWHNCLIGCLHCQQYCPENKAHRDWIEDSWIFSKEETSYIMDRKPKTQLPSETVKKLEQLGMFEYYEIMGRNISVLLSAKPLAQDRVS